MAHTCIISLPTRLAHFAKCYFYSRILYAKFFDCGVYLAFKPVMMTVGAFPVTRSLLLYPMRNLILGKADHTQRDITVFCLIQSYLLYVCLNSHDTIKVPTGAARK
jgi:hypothetical protein